MAQRLDQSCLRLHLQPTCLLHVLLPCWRLKTGMHLLSKPGKSESTSMWLCMTSAPILIVPPGPLWFPGKPKLMLTYVWPTCTASPWMQSKWSHGSLLSHFHNIQKFAQTDRSQGVMETSEVQHGPTPTPNSLLFYNWGSDLYGLLGTQSRFPI